MEKVNDIGGLFFFVRVTLLLSVTSSISRYIFFQTRAVFFRCEFILVTSALREDL